MSTEPRDWREMEKQEIAMRWLGCLSLLARIYHKVPPDDRDLVKSALNDAPSTVKVEYAVGNDVGYCTQCETTRYTGRATVEARREH
jgi:dienelactone hydrolase